MPYNVETLFVCDLSNSIGTKGFKGIRNVHSVTFLVPHSWAIDMPYSRLDRASINNNGWPVVSKCRHETTWHVLVTSRYRNVSVVVLCLNLKFR